MKNLLLTAALLVATTLCLSAQSTKLLFGMPVKSVGISMGVDEDRLSGIGADYFLSQSRDADMRALADDFEFAEKDVYSMICENPYFRIDVALAPRFTNNAELRLGVLGIFNRTDWVSYRNSYEYGSANTDYINFSTYGNELALEGTFLKSTGKKIFNLYGGVGTNIGYTFGNNAFVNGSKTITADDMQYSLRSAGGALEYMENNDAEYQSFHEYVQLRNGISQRVFVMGGMGITLFQKFELALEGRYGRGYRLVKGTGAHGTELYSINVATRWHF